MPLDLIRSCRAALAPAVVAVVCAVVLAGPGLGHRGRGMLAQNATPGPGASPAAEATPAAEAALVAAATYLVAQQAPDGGFVGFSGTSDPGTTADAIVALKAAGIRGVEVGGAVDAALNYLEDQAAAYAGTGAGQAAKLALAVVAAGGDPTRFGGVDLLAVATAPAAVATPEASPVTNPDATPVAGVDVGPAVPIVYGSGIYDHALVILALAAAARPVPPPAIDALRAAQVADGSWSFTGETTPGAGDSNTTAVVVQALVASGNGADPMVAAGLAYLKTVQTPTGQVAYQAADPLVPDANSTALAVQAIVAAGQDPTSIEEWQNAAAGLAAFQNASGAFRYQDVDPADNLLATLQAVPALAGIPLPVGTACGDSAVATATVGGGTPVAVLPAPGRGQVPCVEPRSVA